MPIKCIICKKITPNFGLLNDTKAQYCFTCKEPGMINIKHKKCIICKKTSPSFGLPGNKIAEYCFTCKKEDMIDITNSKCIEFISSYIYILSLLRYIYKNNNHNQFLNKKISLNLINPLKSFYLK